MKKSDKKTRIAESSAVTKLVDSDATRIAQDSQLICGDKKTLQEIKEGEIISGYTVKELFNENGGESVLRYAEKDGKQYVIKIFNARRTIDNKSENIFASINSPYVMPLLAVGEAKGRHYQILPYYKNGTYSAFLNDKQINGDELIKFITQVNEGLHAIHSANVFHNDIKPENIFISNDGNNAVIGDFGISKFAGSRTSITNVGNMSQFYAAPEGDEISTVEGDYFSFGMTILNLVNGKNVFDEMSGQAARTAIISGRIPLPEEKIGADVCDLVYMLTNVRKKRITYDEVCEWLKNPVCFRGCRVDEIRETERLPIDEYCFAVRGENEKFYDALKLAEAMNNDHATALEHYNNDFIQGAINKSSDKTLALDLQKIRKKYSDDDYFGLILTLNAINKNLKIKFNGAEIGDFKDYIDFLQNQYPNIDHRFANQDFINLVLSHTSADEESVNLIKKVIETFKDPLNIYDMLLNLFGTNEKFYYDSKTYKNFGEFLNLNAFTENGNPRCFSWEKIRQDFLFNYLLQCNVDDETINLILSEKDKLLEYFKLGKALNGYLPFQLAGKQIKNLYDLIETVAFVKERGKDAEIQLVIEFLQNGGFEKIELFEGKRQLKLVENVKTAENKLSYIYFNCYKEAKFYGCKTIKELIVTMGKFSENEIEKESGTILESEDFKIWLRSQGVKI